MHARFGDGNNDGDTKGDREWRLGMMMTRVGLSFEKHLKNDSDLTFGIMTPEPPMESTPTIAMRALTPRSMSKAKKV
tara:strand:+ start:358 stop:588 length:231 start_codon:yes stop_codon:yes gene_type:complete